MHQISLNQSDHASLTVEQRSAWSDQGFLVLKSHLSASEVGRLTGDAPADERAVSHQALVESLNGPVGEILDADPILLTLRRGVAERFGLDALDVGAGPVIGGAAALVMLGSSPGWELSLFAGSHRIAPDWSLADRGAQMFHLSQGIRELGLRRETLTLAPGDVWLRHPRLMRGVRRLGVSGERPNWLKGVFGRIADLPRPRTSDGLRLGERPAKPSSPAPERASNALGIRAAGG